MAYAAAFKSSYTLPAKYGWYLAGWAFLCTRFDTPQPGGLACSMGFLLCPRTACTALHVRSRSGTLTATQLTCCAVRPPTPAPWHHTPPHSNACLHGTPPACAAEQSSMGLHEQHVLVVCSQHPPLVTKPWCTAPHYRVLHKQCPCCFWPSSTYSCCCCRHA